MRGDSWQVQRRLTAKRRWQRGKTEELSQGSLCERFFGDFFLVVRRSLEKLCLFEVWFWVNVGFKAMSDGILQDHKINILVILCDRFLYFCFVSSTGLKWVGRTWKVHTFSFLHQSGVSNTGIKV